MKLASRASRLGFVVGFCATFATGYARFQDFILRLMNKRVELNVRMNPTLSHYHECRLLFSMFTSIWAQTAVFPRRNHFLHDLITQVFWRSFRYGIVVMGFINAFVHAHHQHRRGVKNPWNFGACFKGRIRFMTAISPAFARVHVTCLKRHMLAVPRLNFWLAQPKARYPHLPNVRTTRKR